ncbi:hypothetical protein [Xanthomonas citri]|uniref:hypothetical protein n=1 Tax=Xanthomonas citri TaxID=346 RepID=UPI000C1780A8|nr:hypothetical protein [Xanthomonas citri]ATS54076.1 hypothetical protein XcfCFBP6994P_01905 [Xanthomonas citri pv. phaseoli var. fuscans]SOO32788.1 hypothetical protein XFF6994_2350006 [Xanthomonas citri pv. fuscans]
MRKLNMPTALIAICWWAMETSYFGWKTMPGSTTELFADGMALTLLAAAFAFPQHGCVRVEVRNG